MRSSGGGRGKGGKLGAESKGKDNVPAARDDDIMSSMGGGSAMHVKPETTPAAKPRRVSGASLAAAAVISPASANAPQKATIDAKPYLTNVGVEAYADELLEAPHKCGRTGCPNTLAKAGNHDEFKCNVWGNYSFEWKKVDFPAGPARWDCGPACDPFAFIGNPGAVIAKCNEGQDHFKQSHEVEGFKLSRIDNPDDPTSKMQVFLVNDAERLADVGVIVEYGVSRSTTEDEYRLMADNQLVASQGKGFFAEMVRPSGQEGAQCKRRRLQDISCDACAPRPVLSPAGDGEPADGAEAAEDGGDLPMSQEEQQAKQPAKYGYWTNLTRGRWGFVATVVGCRADDEDKNDDEDDAASTVSGGGGGQLKLGGNFESMLQERLRAINLTTIASGRNNLGHERARLKARGDTFSGSSNQVETDAAGFITKRLDLAVYAEDLSNRELLHTLPPDVFETKVTALVSTGMVIPVSLAVEIGNRAASALGAEIVSGSSDDIVGFFKIVLPTALVSVEGEEQLQCPEGELGFDWRGPRGYRIPGDAAAKTVRFESATFPYLRCPLLRSWATSRTTGQCIGMCQKIDQVLINSMGEDVDGAIQLSVNSAVECLRAAQYVMDPDPLNFKFAADFDALSAAEPPSDGQWKGLRFYFNERMCETAAFANNVVSIKKTKVTHPPSVDNIRFATMVLEDQADPIEVMPKLEERIKNMATLRKNSREGATKVLEVKLMAYLE
ncbi:unnamed protein product, partial [Prorocentrum cordatum]